MLKPLHGDWLPLSELSKRLLVGAARLLIPNLGSPRLSLLPHLSWSSRSPRPAQVPRKRISTLSLNKGVARNLWQSTTNLQMVFLSIEEKELRS